MQKMKPGDHSHLTDKIVRLLMQNRISTILDFLQEDVEKLSTLTKLSVPDVLAVRLDYFKKYSAILVNGSSLLLNSLISRKFISTGIQRLDTILNGGIPIGCITELFGLAGCGKTQLSYQLAINCVKNTDCTILYIDTKGDYSAVRIQKLLQACGHSHKEMAHIMFKIKVVHIWTMDKMIEFLLQLKKKIISFDKLCLILIDSLPCLMFQYLGDNSKIGLALLNIFVNHCKYICKELDLSIICINVQTRWVDQDIIDMEDDNQSVLSKDHLRVEKRTRCLGRYWQHIPALVLLLDIIEDGNQMVKENNCGINVTVVKSIFGQCSLSCSLTLNNLGVS